MIQVGDFVRFIDNPDNRDFWGRHFKQHFNFKDIVEVVAIHSNIAELGNFEKFAMLDSLEKIEPKSQISLPFKW